MPIEVNDQLSIDEVELRFQYFHASGPGGQHVNKNATGVRLLFNPDESPNLSSAIKRRLYEQAGNRIDGEGNLSIRSQRYRSQERNRIDAIQKLVELLEKACQRPKYRVPTRPGRGAKERRLEQKNKRSQTKKMRGKVKLD